MSTRSIIRSVEQSIKFQHEKHKVEEVLTTDKARIQNWWLGYQKDIINSNSPFLVGEKGRRVGLSEALSYKSVVKGITGKQNTYYSTYNFPSTRTFIRKCAKWAKAFNLMSQRMYKKELIDINDIGQHKIVFLNGFFIEAIPDSANSFRDKDSFNTAIIKDEAAFSQQLGPIVEAVKALNVWNAGSTITVVSTHYGEGNEFNKLVKSVRANPKLGEVMRVSFYDAIDQGLYKKICEVNGEEWSAKKELEYITYWTEFYGDAAPQELGAIPQKYGGSTIFDKSMFHYASIPEGTLRKSLKLRGWDLASTEDERARNTTYYTATIQVAIVEETLVVLSAEAQRYSPEDVEGWILMKDSHDDPLTTFVLEEEPGSTGKFFISHFQRMITRRNIDGYTPIASKVVRAQPLIAALKNRKVVLLEENREQLEEFVVVPMTKFDGSPQPLVNDITDVMSMLYNYYDQSFADWISG